MNTDTGAIYKINEKEAKEGRSTLAKLDKKLEKKTGFNSTGPEAKVAELRRQGKLVVLNSLPDPDCKRGCCGTGHIPAHGGADHYEPCACTKPIGGAHGR